LSNIAAACSFCGGYNNSDQIVELRWTKVVRTSLTRLFSVSANGRRARPSNVGIIRQAGRSCSSRQQQQPQVAANDDNKNIARGDAIPMPAPHVTAVHFETSIHCRYAWRTSVV
jgi:uncharacterized membrane protein YccC